MRKPLIVLLLSLAVPTAVVAGEAEATDPPAGSKPLGVELSLRFGPAVLGNNTFAPLAGPMFPLELALGYRFGGLVYVGVAGVYAFGSTETLGGNTVSPFNSQFLAEVALHPLRYARVDPWVGYGLGAEWFDGGTGNFIPVSLSLGVEFALSQTFRAGPFFTVQVAFHGSDVHEWYVVGLKLTALP